GIKRAHLPEAEITDVVPTILGVLGIPIPANLDGKVLEELFEPGVIEKMVFTSDSRPSERCERGEAAVKSEEDRVVIDRLKKLGYL
ncbi:MAG: hypothetical protein V3R93_00920, partial [Candidatus Hydrothermarchaeaceae archaeon]